MRKLIVLVYVWMCWSAINAQPRWTIDKNGNSIFWQVEKEDQHHDHIEMAGKYVATVLRYGVNEDGSFGLNKSMIWPMLRVLPNNTHGSLMRRLNWDPLDAATANGQSIEEQVKKITLNGMMEVVSDVPLKKKNSLRLKRIYFPSVDQPALIEIYEFINTGKGCVSLEFPDVHTTLTTDLEKGVDGSYSVILSTQKAGTITLAPGKSYTCYASVAAYKQSEKKEVLNFEQELLKR